MYSSLKTWLMLFQYQCMDSSCRALQGLRACLKQRLIRSARLLKNFWYDCYHLCIDSGLQLLCHLCYAIESSEICILFDFQSQGFMTGSDLLIKVRFRELSYWWRTIIQFSAVFAVVLHCYYAKLTVIVCFWNLLECFHYSTCVLPICLIYFLEYWSEILLSGLPLGAKRLMSCLEVTYVILDSVLIIPDVML